MQRGLGLGLGRGLVRASGHERTLFWLWLATAWPLSFVGTFFNVALVAAAAAAFDGRRLSLRQALAVSMRRRGPIAFWSLLASTVGALLRVLAERLPLGGRLGAVVLGAPAAPSWASRCKWKAAARSALLAIAIVGLMLISGANGALRQVFALALYRYAYSGDTPAAFSAEDLEHPFAGRRRWWRR